jgi:hypothetical protein
MGANEPDINNFVQDDNFTSVIPILSAAKYLSRCNFVKYSYSDQNESLPNAKSSSSVTTET